MAPVNFDPEAYTLTVQRRLEDGELYYVGTVAELPDIAVYEESFQAAHESLVAVVTTAKELADEMGHSFPEPRTHEAVEVSGRVTLRMPKSLHRQLILAAEEEYVSLNMLIVQKLTQYVSTPSKSQIVVCDQTKSRAETVGWNPFDFGADLVISKFADYFSRVEISPAHRATKQQIMGFIEPAAKLATPQKAKKSPAASIFGEVTEFIAVKGH